MRYIQERLKRKSGRLQHYQCCFTVPVYVTAFSARLPARMISVPSPPVR